MISLVEFVSICGVASLTAAGASQGLQRLRRTKFQRSEERVGVPIEEPSGRPAPGKWHEPRDRKRHAVNCRIEYVLEQVRHEGMLVDMSLRGWRAHAMHPVVKGAVMTVEIVCSDPAQRILIEEAVVRWTDGFEFGVEVIRISPGSAAKLSDYLNMHYPQEEPSPMYALSPFSYS
jgi:hypothetical protein